MNPRPRNRRWMRLIAAFSLLFSAPGPCLAADTDVVDAWQQFERQVKDETISYEDGRAQIAQWAHILPQAYPPGQFDGCISFPMRGYGVRHIGGRRGEGYRPSRYEFLGPKRRIGHPAQDIFVHDGNQDGLDDRTGHPIEVLALAEGIVVSTFSEWTPADAEQGNGRRGGNYVWIYHPALKLFAYYAHLQDVTAQRGERVAGGQVIATLGRTGNNAFAERSPTHLHLMLLRVEDMTPINPFALLAPQSGGRTKDTSIAATTKKRAPARSR